MQQSENIIKHADKLRKHEEQQRLEQGHDVHRKVELLEDRQAKIEQEQVLETIEEEESKLEEIDENESSLTETKIEQDEETIQTKGVMEQDVEEEFNIDDI